MDLPQPFVHPSAFAVRKHGPAGYDDPRSYKDWLRDEFVFRCVYCLERETWYPSGQDAFAVEHVLPRTKRRDLICVYDNLVYACLRCNSFKREVETLDPTKAHLGEHLRFEPDGSVVGLTQEGMEFILLFHLDEAQARELRLEKLRILRLKASYPDDSEVDELFRRAFGFPADLPDLRSPAKRPTSNSRLDGIHECCFVLRLEKRLPAVY